MRAGGPKLQADSAAGRRSATALATVWRWPQKPSNRHQSGAAALSRGRWPRKSHGGVAGVSNKACVRGELLTRGLLASAAQHPFAERASAAGDAGRHEAPDAR